MINNNLYKYLFIFTTGLSILFIILFYLKNKEYNELNISYVELQSKFAVEQANNSSLESSIKSQNIIIENYKKNSIKLEETVQELNATVEKQNQEKIEFENIPVKVEKEIVNSVETKIVKDTNSEDALKWMQEKSSSLVR